MCVELGEEELFILYAMYTRRNLNSARSRHPSTLENIYKKKNFKISLEKTIKNLQNKGLVTAVKKKPVKYYISNPGLAIKLLADNGYLVTKGRERPL